MQDSRKLKEVKAELVERLGDEKCGSSPGFSLITSDFGKAI